MPQGDRTGPDGQGSRSGRGLGYCNGYEQPGYNYRGHRWHSRFQLGYRPGFGLGRRCRYIWDDIPRQPPIQNTIKNEDEEKHYLKQTIHELENQLRSLKNQLETHEQKETNNLK